MKSAGVMKVGQLGTQYDVGNRAAADRRILQSLTGIRAR